MYHLKKSSAFTETASLPGIAATVAEARTRLADSSAGLTFDPGEHRYFLTGHEMRSVSSIVEHFAPFDAMAAASRCAANPRHEHFGKSPEEIVSVWAESGRQAAEAGTQVHAFGEACYLFLSGQEQEMEPEYRERISSEGLAAVSPKEEALARWWADTDWGRYTVVAKETRIVNPLLGYAGTFDLLLYDLFNATFAQKDYKTNKDLEKWYGDMLLPPLSMLRSNDIGKYTVQQTLYTIQLRNISLPVGSNQLVWLRDDGYREVDLPLKYDKVIAWAVSQMNNEIND